MFFRCTAEDLARWDREQQEPRGDLDSVVIEAASICEGRCYNGFADIHAHIVATWTNGAKRTTVIPLTQTEQWLWLTAHRPELVEDWKTDKGWLKNQ